MRSFANYDDTGKWLHVVFVLATCIHAALSQCSGTTLVFTATDTFQVFTSVNYPFGYGNDQDCVWRIEADNVTDAVRMEITDAGIEYHANCVYDYGQVYDGYNTTADSMGKFCGSDKPSYVSIGSYLTVTFNSDYSLSLKGFKARYKSGPRSNLLDKEEDEDQVNILLVLGASVGSVLFILILIMIIYTYIQAKKAKELRRHPNLHRGMRHSRVEPFGYDGGWNYLDGPAPPAYGEIYSSPMSPPPQYCEIDPNPNPTVRLPGRREFMADNQPTDNTNNTGSDSVALRTDTNANTHFIVSRGVATHVNNHTRSRTRTSNTGGGIVNSSLQTLSPTSFHTASNETVSSGNSASINIPGQTQSLPNTVAPPETEYSQEQTVSSNSLTGRQTENIVPIGDQTNSANIAQNDIVTSPRESVTRDEVVSSDQNRTEQNLQDREDTCSTVSEISLPPMPAQELAQIS